ncbi:MAG: dTDP-4-dehydrorhamnose 3,5-epimerase [Bdellovibrionales bacterium RIFOXYD1_FULL_53_11]|nr:MAG: dTDP-4-dehydrorhamnose 3,5-epimerase [Bdellovibrionales bacterium RIFOXYD1_FULL_53_11]
MKVRDFELPGLKLIELDVYRDSRGFFVERFNELQFAASALPGVFRQDNHSRSVPGVVRGFHYQYDPPQSKLVGVVRGRIWDVAIDMRKDSPTFGKYAAIELSGDNGLLLWIPFGFAHGFCVIGDEPADVFYKVDNIYRAPGETGVRWNDPDVGVRWPVERPVVSPRDAALPSLKDARRL